MLNMNGKIFHGNKWPVCVIINYLIVWDVAKNIIPVLIPQIEAVIDKEKTKEQ